MFTRMARRFRRTGGLGRGVGADIGSGSERTWGVYPTADLPQASRGQNRKTYLRNLGSITEHPC